ncbi:hypothetical protein [Spirosoma endophyticum]|uniref:Uncharacterized protein n=1 Tax=Spirosoma endophyticum TaxID=662367 RepID=A0A1I1GW51_9BACT|nr:hypothetical protein [Spirosoma endophyticum]SFC13403.1 hypothetical protein SAMN05216167_101525 [Spirosoma endophyticum]
MTRSKIVNSQDENIETDPQRIVSDWANAIKNFNQWNDKLISILEAHCLTNEDVINPLGKIGNQQAMTDLTQLRLTLVDVLNDLLIDISSVEEEHDTVLKIKNLQKQTRTIQQWNKKIRRALGINSCGIA